MCLFLYVFIRLLLILAILSYFNYVVKKVYQNYLSKYIDDINLQKGTINSIESEVLLLFLDVDQQLNENVEKEEVNFFENKLQF